MAAEWGVFDWLSNDGSAPLIDIFTEASADLVEMHHNIVFESLSSVDSYLRIQDHSLTGNMALMDVSTKQNLDDLVKVGERLLDKPLTRVNTDSGEDEPVPDGGTNGETLKRFAKQLSDERKLRESNCIDMGVLK